MFDLKIPCVTCPFRKGQASGFQLGDERLEEIRRAPAPQCHKTVDYNGGDEDPETGEIRPDQGDKPQQCAGLMTLLTRMGEPNGWHRHPKTGRRRPGGGASKEYIA